MTHPLSEMIIKIKLVITTHCLCSPGYLQGCLYLSGLHSIYFIIILSTGKCSFRQPHLTHLAPAPDSARLMKNVHGFKHKHLWFQVFVLSLDQKIDNSINPVTVAGLYSDRT